MRGWSTLALVVVFAGLVGYIYFVDSKQEPGGSTVKEKPFGSLQADDIEEVQVKSADGETTRLQKTDGKWQVVEPVKTDADTSELTTIASSIATFEINRVVDENATDLKQYGLEPVRLEVAFRSKGQKDLKHLQIGEKTPTGTDLYARFPDQKRVFLVSSFLDTTFNKNTFALRDRRILIFDRNKVDGLELTSGALFSVKVALSATDRVGASLTAATVTSAVAGSPSVAPSGTTLWTRRSAGDGVSPAALKRSWGRAV